MDSRTEAAVAGFLTRIVWRAHQAAERLLEAALYVAPVVGEHRIIGFGGAYRLWHGAILLTHFR